ncbi:MAG: CHAT domain-containing protein [Pirellulales bacterium]
MRGQLASPTRPLCRSALATLIATLLLATPLSSAMAQRVEDLQTSLNGDYISGRIAMAEGNLPEALQRFRSAQRSAQRFGTAYFVDSICYQTMWGECLYHMGDTAGALAHYEAALRILLQWPDWMRAVQYPPNLQPESRPVRANISWGIRQTNIPRFPEQMSIQQGTINPAAAIGQGSTGVMMPARMVPIDVVQVTYCTAIAMRRRLELMGPVCPFTPLSSDLYDLFEGPTYPANHWSGAWGDVLHGLAAASFGEEEKAAQLLQRGSVMAGNFDHPLSGIALLELGKLAWRENQLLPAAKFFAEASVAGAEFIDGDTVEEAWRHYTALHLASAAHGVLPGLSGAAAWAGAAGLYRPQAGLLVTAAENAAEEGLAPQAFTLLEAARRTTRYRATWVGPIYQRWRYVSATANFRAGNQAAGTAALEEAIRGRRANAPWLMHINLTSRALKDNIITPRVAENLYSQLLDDPLDRQWQLDPLQCLTLITTPLDLQFNEWMALAVQRRNLENAVEIYDRFRRRKFCETLPFGGRHLAIGFIADGPDHLLNKSDQLQREFFYAKYPALAQAAHQTLALRASLVQQQRLLAEAPPADPDKVEDANRLDENQRSFRQLSSQFAQIQNALINESRALITSHNPSQFVFLRINSLDTVRDRLPRKQAILLFLPQGRNWTALLVSPEIDRGNYVQWSVPMLAVRQRLAAMLKNLGNVGRDHVLTASQWQNQQWETNRRELSQLILGGAPRKTLDAIDELVIIPDGILWYLPFEMLQMPDEAAAAPAAGQAAGGGRARRGGAARRSTRDDKVQADKPDGDDSNKKESDADASDTDDSASTAVGDDDANQSAGSAADAGQRQSGNGGNNGGNNDQDVEDGASDAGGGSAGGQGPTRRSRSTRKTQAVPRKPKPAAGGIDSSMADDDKGAAGEQGVAGQAKPAGDAAARPAPANAGQRRGAKGLVDAPATPPAPYLGMLKRIRYLPLFSQAGPPNQQLTFDTTSYIYFGHLGPGEPPAAEAQQEIITRFQDSIPGSRRLIPPLPAPTPVLANTWPRLLVLGDLGSSGTIGFGWSPTTAGAPAASETMLAWLEQFGHSPSQILLPGFHSAAEGNLGRATGDELFLSSCSLLVSGARTALLSRWRVGGESTRQLMREMLQELPHQSASAAWQRSVKLLMASELNRAGEPRIGELPDDENSTPADHPFLWAGYLLVDDGRLATPPDANAVPAPAPAMPAVPALPPAPAPGGAPGQPESGQPDLGLPTLGLPPAVPAVDAPEVPVPSGDVEPAGPDGEASGDGEVSGDGTAPSDAEQPVDGVGGGS